MPSKNNGAEKRLILSYRNSLKETGATTEDMR